MTPPPARRPKLLPDGIPAEPPAFVLAEVTAAHERMGRLAEEGVEVGFSRDERGLAITLRSGPMERRLRPSEIFDVLDAF